MKKARPEMGFKQALEYVLDLLAYAYYVKADPIASDSTFDSLERLYTKLFKKDTAPMRGIEEESMYSTGVKVVYKALKNKEM